MGRIAMTKLLLFSMVIAACGFPKLPGIGGGDDDDAGVIVGVGGTVHGMWDGADGVALTLTVNGSDTTQTVTANGQFAFTTPVADGTSYIVAIAANPTGHTCTIVSGANGVVADGHALIDIGCMGPPVAIAMPALPGWTFDPTAETQPVFGVSVIQQDAVVVVTDDTHVVTSAEVAGVATPLGTASAPLPLPLGASTIAVKLAAQGGLSKTYLLSLDRGKGVVAQALYAKASNTDGGDNFGARIAISGDTMVVTASSEASNAFGINGNQADDSASRAGAAYVFHRANGVWTQQAYLKASNTEANDRFGVAVAISGDTIAIGADGEDGAIPGINGNQGSNSASNAGAVYVYHRTGEVWSQQAYVKSSNVEAADQFGTAIALDGDLMAVGAFTESSAATGINGNQADNSAQFAGAVYAFHRTGQTWTQEAYIKASNTQAFDQFGGSVALAGSTLVVGASAEGSSATGINGNQALDDAAQAGAVYVFQRTGTTWAQEAYVKASNTGAGDRFGSSVALSGTTMVIAASQEGSDAVGVGGDQANDRALRSGAVYVFGHDGEGWHQQAYLKASNSSAGLAFGSVAIRGDVIAVGASFENSAATGINGNQGDHSASSCGAAYLFRRSGATWAQTTYIKASNAEANDSFATSVALSDDTLVVPAFSESSAAMGLGGNQGDNSLMAAGAVYLFR